MQNRILTRKIILRIAAGVLALLTAAVVILTVTFDNVIRHAVVAVGSRATGVDVHLDAVELSLFNGEGSLRGFALGNPTGYSSPSCIQFDEASLSLEPASLLSDKVVVRHLRLVSPVITIEGSLTANNFGKLRKRLSSSDEPENDSPQAKKTPEDRGGSRKLQINELTLTGARLNVILKELGGQPQALILPDIQLRDLGSGPEGMTSEELGRRALDRILEVALERLMKSRLDADRRAGTTIEGSDDTAERNAQRATGGMPDAPGAKEE